MPWSAFPTYDFDRLYGHEGRALSDAAGAPNPALITTDIKSATLSTGASIILRNPDAQRYAMTYASETLFLDAVADTTALQPRLQEVLDHVLLYHYFMDPAPSVGSITYDKAMLHLEMARENARTLVAFFAKFLNTTTDSTRSSRIGTHILHGIPRWGS